MSGQQKQQDGGTVQVQRIMDTMSNRLGYCRVTERRLSKYPRQPSSQASTTTAAVRDYIRKLCTWSAYPSMTASMPTDSQRDLKHALRVLGPSNFLQALLDEINAQTKAGLGAVALDVCAHVVFTSASSEHAFAPEAEATMPAERPATRQSLRDALQAQVARAPDIITKDAVAAEAVVRLGRRVDALFACLPAHGAAGIQVSQVEDMMAVDMDLAGADAMNTGPPVDLDAGVASAALGFDTGTADALGFNIDHAIQSQGTGDVTGSLLNNPVPSADDDIFGDLVLEDDPWQGTF